MTKVGSLDRKNLECVCFKLENVEFDLDFGKVV